MIITESGSRKSKCSEKAFSHKCVGFFCTFCFWGSVGNHLHNAKLEAELLMLLVGCWLRWPGDCSWSRLTALLLGRLLLGVLVLHWDSLDGVCCSLKPESWAGWFPLKYSPTYSYRWLHCGFQNVRSEHRNCIARTQLVNWSRRLANWLYSLGTMQK
jgi:hypothetical protein